MQIGVYLVNRTDAPIALPPRLAGPVADLIAAGLLRFYIMRNCEAVHKSEPYGLGPLPDIWSGRPALKGTVLPAHGEREVGVSELPVIRANGYRVWCTLCVPKARAGGRAAGWDTAVYLRSNTIATDGGRGPQ